MEKYSVDCLIIGAGVAGISIGRQLSESLDEIFILEKNTKIGEETTSRNSEVIHAGIYYDPHSLKASLCVRGKELLYEYLEDNNIQYNKCGKFIISNSYEDSEKLEEIIIRAKENGVEDLIYQTGLDQYDFLKANKVLFSPSTGIFDSHEYLQSLMRDFESQGGRVLLNNKLTSEINYDDNKFFLRVKDLKTLDEFIIETKFLINCAGLNAAKIANLIYEEERYKSKYLKGEYYSYSGKEKLRHLIYPAPQEFSLGIHATIDLGSGIRFGPSAYEINEVDYEVQSSNKPLFLKSVNSYWPSINEDNLYPSYSGIRPLVEGQKDIILDISSIQNKILVNILGYASPGLTSSLAMAEKVDELINNL